MRSRSISGSFIANPSMHGRRKPITPPEWLGMAELESGHKGRVVTYPRPLLKSTRLSSTLRVFQAGGARMREEGRRQGRNARLAGGLVYDSRARRATLSIPTGSIRNGFPKSLPSLGFGDRPIRDKGCRQTPDLTSSLDNIRIIRRQRHIREVLPDRACDEPETFEIVYTHRILPRKQVAREPWSHSWDGFPASCHAH